MEWFTKVSLFLEGEKNEKKTNADIDRNYRFDKSI